jgi:hypothetical protein
LALVGASIAASPGCRGGASTVPADGGPDVGNGDGPAPLTLDIAVTGCASYDPVEARCTGSPPLRLSFAPVGSPELIGFIWTFGDGTPQVTERAPLHHFALPGTYMVRLVGVGAGDLGQVLGRKDVQVVVEPLPAGASCDVESQCADGFKCVCGPGAGCGPGFVRGLCSTACDIGGCGVGAVCASLAIGPVAPDGGANTGSPTCLATCVDDPDCEAGLTCVAVPAYGSAAPPSWAFGCLPAGAANGIGAPCRDQNGNLDDDRCASGMCADLGALGVCSGSCDDTHPCPAGSACASLAGGRRLCLVECLADIDCARDPLLACSTAGVTPLCAPKVCASDADCAPAGRCGQDARCVRT